MTTGEKRSLTSSLKKNSTSFMETIQGDFLSYPSKKAFLESFYTYWFEQSNASNLSWCKNTDIVSDPLFKKEMMERIEEMFAEELQVFDKKEIVHNELCALRQLRSKKKRLRKKREKLLVEQV